MEAGGACTVGPAVVETIALLWIHILILCTIGTQIIGDRQHDNLNENFILPAVPVYVDADSTAYTVRRGQ